jgi:hypothetical protein
MTTILLDKKMFDYEKIKEPLVAIPQSLLTYFAESKIQTPFKYFKTSVFIQTKTKKTTKKDAWYLSAKNIETSSKKALAEHRSGKTISSKELWDSVK